MAAIGSAATVLDPSRPPATSARIRRNTLVNLAGGVAPLALLLVTVPRYLDAIGEARYGVLVVAWVLLGAFGAFDLGLGRAVANRIATMHAAPPEERAALFSTSLALTLALGSIGGLALFLVGSLLAEHVLALPPGLRSEVRGAIPWLAASVPLVTAVALVRGALEGRERFVAANVLAVVAITLFQVVPLAVAYAHGPDLPGLLAGATLASLASVIVGLFLSREYLAARRFGLERAHVGSLLRYGGWATVTAVVGPVLHAVDRLVIASTAGARAIAYYAVPFSLVGRVEIVPASFARTLFPRFSMLGETEARALARDALRALVVVLTPIVVVGLVALEPFLRIWVGPELADRGAAVGEILLVGLWMNGLAYVPFALLQGQRRPDLPAKFHVFELPPYLLALWLGLSLAGIEGAAFAWTLRAAADAALLLAASRIPLRGEPALASSGAIVAVAAAAALTIFSDALAHAVIGTALVVLALLVAARAAPEPLRASFRDLPGVRLVLGRPA